MTLEQKQTWINYFQYLHSKKMDKFLNNLSLAQCLDKTFENNIVITNFIDIFYRYKPLDFEITNAYSVQFDFVNIPIDQEFEVTYIQNGVTLFDFIGTKDELINYTLNNINATDDYIAFINNDIIYVYTYNPSYTFADLPTINITVTEPEYDVTVSISSLINDVSFILNLQNCLTVEEMCKIKNQLLILLK